MSFFKRKSKAVSKMSCCNCIVLCVTLLPDTVAFYWITFIERSKHLRTLRQINARSRLCADDIYDVIFIHLYAHARTHTSLMHVCSRTHMCIRLIICAYLHMHAHSFVLYCYHLCQIMLFAHAFGHCVIIYR